MKFVLIYFVAFFHAGGPDHVEFGDLEACEKAKIELMDRKFRQQSDFAFCVPYSTQPPKT